jgi:hypothetical protein
MAGFDLVRSDGRGLVSKRVAHIGQHVGDLCVTQRRTLRRHEWRRRGKGLAVDGDGASEAVQHHADQTVRLFSCGPVRPGQRREHAGQTEAGGLMAGEADLHVNGLAAGHGGILGMQPGVE